MPAGTSFHLLCNARRQKAQDTFAKTYDSALESYADDESRAARTAYASLKHSYEKVGLLLAARGGAGAF